MIPKVIHYCWFGPHELPTSVLKCTDSWKLHLPEYKIKKWTIDNTAKFHNRYFKQAIDRKMWAFASDYIRFCILSEYGGIYMDTDMLFLKPFRDDMINNSLFLGKESDDAISFGIIGSVPEHEAIIGMKEYYDTLEFDYLNPPIIPKIFTPLLLRLKIDKPNRIKLYPIDVFYPLPADRKDEDYQDYITENTIAIHLWDFSWANLYYPKKLRNTIIQLTSDLLKRKYSFKFIVLTIIRLTKRKINSKRR
jgi:mannosyltransferase OCH1-like enzyme